MVQERTRQLTRHMIFGGSHQDNLTIKEHASLVFRQTKIARDATKSALAYY